MKSIIFLVVLIVIKLISTKSTNFKDKSHQDYRLNPFIFGSNGCLFQGCECSAKSNPINSVTCDGQVHKDYKGMFPLRKDQSYAKINDFYLLNNQFYSIPPKIFQRIEIKNLVFLDNSFDSIFFDSFADISSIDSLEFINNNFHEVDQDSFAPLFNKLNRLAFYGNELTDDATRKVQNSIQHFKNLTFLAMENFSIKDSSDWLKIKSEKLRVLDLSKNYLTSFPFIIDSNNNSLKNLAELYLSSNIIGPLFQLSHLNSISTSLQVLDLSKNKIQALKTNSHIFKKLEKLDLSENELKFVYREYFEKMPNLIELNLQNNLIYQIDIDSFHNNFKLATLILSDNQINYLDSKLTDSLQNLKNFYLRKNFLDSIPSIFNMTSLEVFDISDQQVGIFNVPDFSFERKNSVSKMLISLTGSSGLILNLGDKAFCSKDRRQIIDYMEFSHINMPKSRVCLLGQLKNATIDLFQENYSKFYYDFSRNKICNCYVIDFLNNERINFGKSCKIDLNKCGQEFFQQQDRAEFDLDCKSLQKFEC